MNKMLQIALNDIRINFQDNSIWLNLVVIPIALIFVVGFASGGFGNGGEPDLLLDVFDRDDSELSTQFLETLRDVNTTFVLCPMDNTEDDICQLGDDPLTLERAQQRVQDGPAQAIIEVPAGFAGSVFAGDEANIIYRSDVAFGEPDPIQQSVQAAVQRVGGASVAARVALDVFEQDYEFAGADDRTAFRQRAYDQAQGIWDAPPATVNYQVAGDEDASSTSNGFAQSVPGMGTMYVMFTVLAGAVILIQERKQWTFQRMMTMPVTRAQIIGGKMLARFVMGMIQYAVAFTVGFLLGVNFGDDPVALVTIMVVFTLCMTAITLALATAVENEFQASSVVTFAALTLAPLGGAWWPLEIVPDFMQTIGRISPVAWAMDSFSELTYFGGTLVDILPNMAVLLGVTAVFFVFGVLNFKYE